MHKFTSSWEEGFLKAAAAKGIPTNKAKSLLQVVQVRIVAVGQPTDTPGEAMKDVFNKSNKTVQVSAPKNNLPIGRATDSIIERAKRA